MCRRTVLLCRFLTLWSKLFSAARKFTIECLWLICIQNCTKIAQTPTNAETTNILDTNGDVLTTESPIIKFKAIMQTGITPAMQDAATSVRFVKKKPFRGGPSKDIGNSPIHLLRM